jgi:hypothetical protein
MKDRDREREDAENKVEQLRVWQAAGLVRLFYYRSCSARRAGLPDSELLSISEFCIAFSLVYHALRQGDWGLSVGWWLRWVR